MTWPGGGVLRTIGLVPRESLFRVGAHHFRCIGKDLMSTGLLPSSPKPDDSNGSRVVRMPALFDFSRLREFFFMLREYWLLGLAFGALCAGLFVFWKIREIPTYRAFATISFAIDPDKVIDIETVEETGLRGPLEADLNQHLRQISGQSFLERLSASFTRHEAAAITGSYQAPERPPPSLLGVIAGGVDVRYVSNSRMLEVAMIHRDPEVAAMVANRAIEEYPRFLLERTSISNRSAIAYLQEKADILRSQVEESESRLQAYRSEHQLVSLEENQNIIVGRLKSLNEALTQARVRLSEADSREDQIKSAQESGDDLTEIPTINRYGALPTVLQRIKELEVEREVLSERYLRRHPRMIENSRELEALEKQKEALVRQAVTELANHRRQIVLEIERLSSELARAEGAALELDKRAIEYNVLRQQLANDRQSYQTVLKRLNETNITRDLDLTNIEVVDQARIPYRAFSPNQQQIFLRGGVTFLLVFFGLPVVLHYMNDKVRHFSDVEGYLNLDLIGDFPESKGNVSGGGSALELVDDYVRECASAISSRIQVIGGDYRPKTLLVTSSIPQEGKTTVVHHLALALNENGRRVLAVDFDWRRPSLSGAFGVRNEKGLIPWLQSESKVPDSPEAALEDSNLGFIRLRDGLDLLGSGGHSKTPHQLISRARIDELLASLKPHYDFIVLDTPPVGVFPDGYFLARLADESIFVCRQNAISHRRVKHLVDRLNDTQAGVIGVVLNRVKKRGADGYRGTYGYGYTYEYKAYRKYYDSVSDKGS